MFYLAGRHPFITQLGAFLILEYTVNPHQVLPYPQQLHQADIYKIEGKSYRKKEAMKLNHKTCQGN
ncbi:MAG: hypothetical protein ACI9JR_000090 [Gammaproteobacteria bacterium]|jgi:hypothetical protein